MMSLRAMVLILLSGFQLCAYFPGERLDIRPGNQSSSLITAAQKYMQRSDSKRSRPTLSRTDQLFTETFMSFKDFMEECLHNPDWGYYGSGNVLFSQEHFLTVPKQVSPAFGAMILYQAYAMWRSMLQAQETTSQEPFYLIEFGAGDGDLANDILSSLERNVLLEQQIQETTQWQQFYRIIKYIIGERSPALCIRQRARNKKFIELGICDVLNTDARSARKCFDRSVKGLIFSNELLDTFCLHKVLAHKDQPWKICYVVPVLKKSFFEVFNNNPILQRYKIVVEDNDRFSRKQHAVYLASLKLADDDLVLNKQGYLYLKTYEKMQSAAYDAFLRLEEVYQIDVDSIDEVRSYLDQHGAYMRCLTNKRDTSRQRFFYLNVTASQFMQEVAAILDKGFVLTIDYGSNAMIHDWQLTYPSTAIRMYPENSSCYQKPGFADITSDVNFTDLYFAGQPAGLALSFFGAQSALQGNFIAIGEGIVLPPFDMKNELFAPLLPTQMVDYFCTSPNAAMFKLLIQKKVSGENKYQVLAQSEHIFPVT